MNWPGLYTSRYPTQLRMTDSIRNAQIEKRIGWSISHLDVDDLLDEEISKDLGENGAADEPLPVRILGHALQVAGGHHQQREHRAHRQQGQNRRRQTPVRAGCLHLALQTEALADDVRQAREDFAEIAAGLLLQQHR